MSLNNITANLRKAFLEYINEIEESEINTENSNSDNSSDDTSNLIEDSASIFFKHAKEFKQYAESSLKSLGLSVEEIRTAIDAAIHNSYKGDDVQIDEADEKTDEELNKKLEAKSNNNINNESIKQQAKVLGITPEELVEIVNQTGINSSEITPDLLKQYSNLISQNDNNSDNTANTDVNSNSADTEAKETTESGNNSKNDANIPKEAGESTESSDSKDEKNSEEAKETNEETTTNKTDSTNNTSNTDSAKTTTDTSTNTTNTNNTNATNSSSTTDTSTNTSNTNNTNNTNTTTGDNSNTGNTSNVNNAANTTDTSTTTSTTNKEVENLLADIFKDTKALDSLDSDVDGKLSEEEKNKFKEYVKGKNDEITLENLNKAYDLIKNGKFDYNTPLDEITNTTNSATNTTDTANTTDTSNNSSADSADSSDKADSSSGSSGTHSPSSSSGGGADPAASPASSSGGVDDPSNTQNPDDLTNMSVEDLKSKRDTEIAPSVETAKSDLEKAKTEGDSLIKEKQEAYDKEKEQHDEAKKKYEDALGEDKFLTSPEGKELKEKLEENLQAISEAEEAKDKATQDISEKENALSEAKTNTITKQSEYTQAQANTAAAQSKVDSLQSAVDSYDPNNEETKSQYEAAKAALESAKAELEKAKKAEEAAKNALDEAKKAEEEAQEALNTAIDALTEASSAFDNAKGEREEIEKQIEENCESTTLEAYQNYMTQVENLDAKQTEVQEATNTKLEAMTKAEESLKENQAKLDEINALITQKEGEEEASKLKSEHSAFDDSLTVKQVLEQYPSENDKIEYIAQLAIDNYKNSHILPSVVIAQCMHESSWLESGLSANNNNCFGIKADSNWKGNKVNLPTTEDYGNGLVNINDNFRVYASLAESIKDHGEFLNGPRYKDAVTTCKNYADQIRAIKRMGYATGKQYAEHVIQLVQDYGLDKYDKMVL